MTLEYDLIAEKLAARGDDVVRVEEALRGQEVETPSWAFGNSGTRFAVFAQPGAPRDPFEKLEDAAEVHRLTGIAPSVALHIPWDKVENLNALRERAEELGLRLGAINPNLFQEPEFYAMDLADWGSALLVCQELGERAKVLVDLGHHAQGVNIEQIVSLLHGAGRLGGFHFNDRKYGDDDLIVGSIDPFQLFRIFYELVDTGALERGVRLTVDQSHNIEPKIEAMVQTVMNLQEAYAKALLVDRQALGEAQSAGDVLGANRVLMGAFATDVRELCAEARSELGASADPIGDLRASGYVERAAETRGEGQSAT